MTGVDKCRLVMEQVNKAVIGKEDVVKNVMTAIIAGGHVLLEDIPGVGKTTMAVAFSKAMSLTYGRMQFTPDVMPSDVTGFSVYNKEKDRFEYREGVIMCNFFLADEINRTSSKTQSSLLEAMEEKKVTVDGTTYMLKKPFVVMATQNPIGSIGTSMLPESQLDRFMMRLSVGYPDYMSEVAMLKSRSGEGEPIERVQSVMGAEELTAIQEEAAELFVHDDIYNYVVSVVNATRRNQNIMLGVSPRGSVALINAAKALAYISGRDYVIPDDVKAVAYPVINHRLLLSNKARSVHVSERSVVADILASVAVKNSR